ncbi:iron complex outermembrane recepter protein [Tenacibaculum sp. MAR_2009_124]|uniref:TonB-dependent receptor n=1 Tax=Tenacibaculum sp. MAR_2009_124 TaxID=1250059 RepID=UPI000894609A|nr:TonB-dependent receptor [Tenacibaculum sp. MAR_2009_124]SEC26222.1 iron complex outermembrane recepter protein [Tenacibaculum sp. MAR_2009_124]
MTFHSFVKKVNLVAFLTIMLTTLNVNAQSVILTGKVISKNQKPLEGASVIIPSLKKGTITDAEGKFKLKLEKGNYQIEVSFVGYKPIQKQVNTDNTKELVFQLSSENSVLDEVLVSAVRVKADAPVTHSNLSKKEIAKRNLGQDIPVLLNYLPSVTSSSDAGAGIGYTYIRVRGSDASRVNVTINGIPYNDAESQGTFWVNMGDFASSTENLQLQRGVGTSTNGSGAFGASLNILTDAVSEEAGGEISNSFGSFGTRKHTVKFTTGKINENFEFAGRLSNIYSDGYVDRAFTDLKSYFLQGSYTDENTLIKALAFGGQEKTYQAWFGLTKDQLEENRRQNPYTYDNETDNYWQDHYQLHWNEKLSDEWTTNIGLNYTRGKGYFEQFKDGENAADYNNLINDDSDVIVRRWLDNHFYVANGTITYNKEDLEVISGVSYSTYNNEHYGEIIWGSDLAANTNWGDRYYFSDSKKTDWSVFSKVSFNITNSLKAFVDIQGRFVNYKTKGLTSDRDAIDVDKQFNFFNPKLGLTHRFDEKHSIYASYGRANREPNRNDFEGGNSQHESLNDYELGWRFSNEKIKLNTNIYYMDYQNQLILTGAIDPNSGEPLRSSSGNSYRFGIEIDADIQLDKTLSIRPNIAFSENINQDYFSQIDGELTNLGDTPITFSPDIIFGNALVYQPISNLQLAFLSKYVGKQFMSNLNSSVTDLDVLKGFFTSDFNLTYELKTKKIFKSIVFTGVVNNIFNKEYVDRGYYYTYDDTWSNPGTTTTLDGAGYYPQATRNFLLGATLKF